eukprot:COSAG06_NODE_14285_length_1170_cov_1.319328_1_plen_143_part_00
MHRDLAFEVEAVHPRGIAVEGSRRGATADRVAAAAWCHPATTAALDIIREEMLDRRGCESTVSFLSFPYICPEPVLAKISFCQKRKCETKRSVFTCFQGRSVRVTPVHSRTALLLPLHLGDKVLCIDPIHWRIFPCQIPVFF